MTINNGCDLRFAVAECTRTGRFKAFVISPKSLVGVHVWDEAGPRSAIERLVATLSRAIAGDVAASPTLDEIQLGRAIWLEWARTNGEVTIRRDYAPGDGRQAVDVQWCNKTGLYRAAIADLGSPKNDWRAVLGEGLGDTPEEAVEALFDRVVSRVTEVAGSSELPRLLAQLQVVRDAWRDEPRPWHAFGRLDA